MLQKKKQKKKQKNKKKKQKKKKQKKKKTFGNKYTYKGGNSVKTYQVCSVPIKQLKNVCWLNQHFLMTYNNLFYYYFFLLRFTCFSVFIFR